MKFSERKEQWISFMDMSSNVKTIILVDCAIPDLGPRPLPYPDRIQERIDFAVRAYEGKMERAEWLPDDAMPAVLPYTGTEIFAEAFGSPVHLPGNGMPFARPLIYSVNEIGKVKVPPIEGTILGQLFEIAYQLKRRCGKDAVLALPDIQSPFDIAALIWEKADFLASMIVEPKAVEDLCAMTEQTLIEFLDRWFSEFGTDYLAHFPDYFMRGGLTLSEDEIGEFSPAMFDQFCLDGLNRLSERYGGIGIHTCAHSKHQWENLKKIKGLRLLNLVQPPKVLREGYKFFEGVAQMHSWFGDGEPSEGWTENFPAGAHVVIRSNATDKEEALRKCDQLRQIAELRARR